MHVPVGGAPAWAGSAGHRHRWSGVDFLVADGHPFVRVDCACGAVRRYRAFERFWDPDADPRPAKHRGTEGGADG